MNIPLGNVDITCGGPVNYDWGIDAGQNQVGTSRYMLRSPGSTVQYDLMKEGYVLVGDTGLNSIEAGYTETSAHASHGVVAHTGDGTTDSHPVYANVYPATATSTGIHYDTVHIVVVW